MNKKRIKALMLTDYYQMPLMYIVVLLVMVCKMIFNLFVSAASGNCSFLMDVNASIIMMVFVSTTFQTESLRGVTAFKKAMPYRASELVFSKYIIPISLSVMSVVSSAIFSLIGSLLCKKGMSPYLAQEICFSAAVSVLGTSVMPIIFYPLFFKYGYQRVSKVFAVLGGTIIVITTILCSSGIFAAAVDKDGGPPVSRLSQPVCAVVVLVVAAGYVISCRAALKACKTGDA